MAQSRVSFFKSTKPKRVILSKMTEFAHRNGFSLTSELRVGWQATIPGNSGYSPEHQTDWTNTHIFLASISSLTSRSNSNLSSCPRPQGNSLWKTCNYKPTSLKISAPWNPCWPWKSGKPGTSTPASPTALNSYLPFNTPLYQILLFCFSFTLLLSTVTKTETWQNIKISCYPPYICAYIQMYVYFSIHTYHIHLYIYNNFSNIQIYPYMYVSIYLISPPLCLPIRNVCWGKSCSGLPLDEELKATEGRWHQKNSFSSGMSL